MIKIGYCLFQQFLILGEQMVPSSSITEVERLCGLEMSEIVYNKTFIPKRFFSTLPLLISDFFPIDIGNTHTHFMVKCYFWMLTKSKTV